MRAGIGLIGLLLSVAIIFYMMFGGPGNPGYVRGDLEAQKQADKEVEQISGKDSNGKLATDSVTIEASDKGILVKNVESGGAFDQHFGLQTGDVILDIGPLDAKTQASDDSTAKAYLHDAYARNEQLVVQRGPKRLTLPDDRTPPPPGTPQPQQQRMNPMLQAHNLVNKIESH